MFDMCYKQTGKTSTIKTLKVRKFCQTYLKSYVERQEVDVESSIDIIVFYSILKRIKSGKGKALSNSLNQQIW